MSITGDSRAQILGGYVSPQETLPTELRSARGVLDKCRYMFTFSFDSFVATSEEITPSLWHPFLAAVAELYEKTTCSIQRMELLLLANPVQIKEIAQFTSESTSLTKTCHLVETLLL